MLRKLEASDWFYIIVILCLFVGGGAYKVFHHKSTKAISPVTAEKKVSEPSIIPAREVELATTYRIMSTPIPTATPAPTPTPKPVSGMSDSQRKRLIAAGQDPDGLVSRVIAPKPLLKK